MTSKQTVWTAMGRKADNLRAGETTFTELAAQQHEQQRQRQEEKNEERAQPIDDDEIFRLLASLDLEAQEQPHGEDLPHNEQAGKVQDSLNEIEASVSLIDSAVGEVKTQLDEQQASVEAIRDELSIIRVQVTEDGPVGLAVASLHQQTAGLQTQMAGLRQAVRALAATMNPPS